MSKSLGIRGILIILLTLATALIHISLLFPDTLFILNGLGYITLLVLYLSPSNLTQNYRGWIRWVFIGYTLVTILAWVAIGDKSWPGDALGYSAKAIEIALIILLFLDRDR